MKSRSLAGCTTCLADVISAVYAFYTVLGGLREQCITVTRQSHMGGTYLSDKASYGVNLHMQLICMAKKRGTKVINVVRREDVVQELKDLGYASHISGLHAFLEGQPCCVASARAAEPCAQGSVKLTRCFGLHVSSASVKGCICTAGRL